MCSDTCRTVRGSVGCGNHHHSGLEQRLKKLLQDHGISDVSHLTEGDQTRRRGDTFRYCIIYLFLATPNVCASEVKPCHQHSMLISVIQVCSFNPLCLVMAIRTRMHLRAHTHTHTHTSTTWTDCKWSWSGFLLRTSSWGKAADPR